jgi:S1-C subfamily serine protease
MLALSQQIQGIVGAAAHAVVGVRAQGRQMASGFVWRPGVVVTASDAIEAGDDLSVRLADKSVPARLAGRDSATGMAVLRIGEELPEPLRPATGQAPHVGQMVLATRPQRRRHRRQPGNGLDGGRCLAEPARRTH